MPERQLSLRVDDLEGADIQALLAEHLADMATTSPPESMHSLGLDELRSPDITVYSAWIGTQLAGCCALKKLEAGHVELKSMRTAEAFRRRGVAKALLEHLLEAAKNQGYTQVSLETGPGPEFAPAIALYKRFGFETCGPFGSYQADPHSLFMTRNVSSRRA